MKRNNLISDQLTNWSVIHEREINCDSTAKTKNTPSRTTSFRGCSQRFFNRTLQALWQTRVKMCTWTRSWPKVLFVNQQVWAKAPDGLHPAGSTEKGRTIPSELPQDKDYPRRALRDQPRTFTAQGKVLARSPPSLRGQRDGKISGRCRRDSNSLRQYDRGSDAIRFRPILGQGG